MKRSVWKVRASHLEANGGRLKAVRMTQQILINPQDSVACMFVKPALLEDKVETRKAPGSLQAN